jgi:hypothetical protein
VAEVDPEGSQPMKITLLAAAAVLVGIGVLWSRWAAEASRKSAASRDLAKKNADEIQWGNPYAR